MERNPSLRLFAGLLLSALSTHAEPAPAVAPDAAHLFQQMASDTPETAFAAKQALVKQLDAAAVAREVHCRRPDAAAVAAERSQLADFRQLVVSNGALEFRALAANELDDLAYLFASVDPAATNIVDPDSARRVGDQKRAPNAEREVLSEAALAAQKSGDVAATVVKLKGYLGTLGYPGPIDWRRENAWGWHGARASHLLRTLGLAEEILGAPADAERAYRAANPGGGACGTGWEVARGIQMQAIVRTAEAAGDCRGGVEGRLLDPNYPSHDLGVAALRLRGYDVARLYRGALLTLYRDVDAPVWNAALSRASSADAPAVRAREQRLGREAWDFRISALEGFADEAQRAALPRLTAIALHAAGDATAAVQTRALSALTNLARRTSKDPCAKVDEESYGIEGDTGDRRAIHTLAGCGGALSMTERDALATALEPGLRAESGYVRMSTAEALGKIGSIRSRAPLTALRSTDQDHTACICQGEHCEPFYQIRAEACRALYRIDRLEDDADAGSNVPVEQCDVESIVATPVPEKQ